MTDEYDIVFDLLDSIEDQECPILHLHPDYLGIAINTAIANRWARFSYKYDVSITPRGLRALVGHRRQKRFDKEMRSRSA